MVFLPLPTISSHLLTTMIPEPPDKAIFVLMTARQEDDRETKPITLLLAHADRQISLRTVWWDPNCVRVMEILL